LIAGAGGALNLRGASREPGADPSSMRGVSGRSNVPDGADFSFLDDFDAARAGAAYAVSTDTVIAKDTVVRRVNDINESSKPMPFGNPQNRTARLKVYFNPSGTWLL